MKQKARVVNKSTLAETNKVDVKPTTKTDDADKYITSLEIARMFGTQHPRTLERIEYIILPSLSEDEKAGFEDTFIRNKMKRDIRVYKLNLDACNIYLKYMDDFKGYPTVEIGISQMKLLMEERFAVSPESFENVQNQDKDKNSDGVKVLPDLSYINLITPEDVKCITSVQIAEMFHTTNAKVGYKIRKIQEMCSPQQQEDFKMEFVRCVNCKPQRVYMLNHNACKTYIAYSSRSKRYTNVVAGIAKMQELMKVVFYPEKPITTI